MRAASIVCEAGSFESFGVNRGMLNAAISRRHLLASGALAGASALLGGRPAAGQEDKVAFFFVSDTHYLADRIAPVRLDARAAANTCGLISQLNRLPGTDIAEEAGGGKVLRPKGVIHGGDLIDSGDKTGGLFDLMQQREWLSYTEDFGLTGKDGRLKYPVYEVYGNHDAPAGSGYVIDRLRERNRKRADLKNLSANGLHYSWDWGPLHLVNLGIVVGSSTDGKDHSAYAPMDSLAFLAADLAKNVGNSGRPVVLTHHVDVIRYTGPCDPIPERRPEWDPCSVRAYYNLLKPYRIASIQFGHTHQRFVLQWDGETAMAKKGHQLLNVAKGAHFSGPTQAFFYIEATAKELLVREYQTMDSWKTGSWTPQVWRRDLTAV